MPRDGSGAGDNAIEPEHNIAHGAPDGSDAPSSSGVDRSSKAAPPPQLEKGDALDGMNASGGGSSGAHIGNQGSGKGEKDAFVEREGERLARS